MPTVMPMIVLTNTHQHTRPVHAQMFHRVVICARWQQRARRLDMPSRRWRQMRGRWPRPNQLILGQSSAFPPAISRPVTERTKPSLKGHRPLPHGVETREPAVGGTAIIRLSGHRAGLAKRRGSQKGRWATDRLGLSIAFIPQANQSQPPLDLA
jgi:hypothetical protein